MFIWASICFMFVLSIICNR